ncbi:MAG: hypothetical protein H6Q17_263 [Bacteroidetes bacterium]|jgi:hypothetical protein|nr:hypothetical protein [Bacteroidota bacterium]
MLKYHKYHSPDASVLVSNHAVIAIKPVEIKYACSENTVELADESGYYSDLLQSVIYCKLSYNLKKMGVGIQPCRITNERISAVDIDEPRFESRTLCERLGVDGLVTTQVELPALLGKNTRSMLNGWWLRCIGTYTFSLVFSVCDGATGRIVWQVHIEELLSPSRRIRHVISTLKDECKLLPYYKVLLNE